MQVLRSGSPLRHTVLQQVSTASPEGRSSAQLVREELRSESLRSRAWIASTDLSFAVDSGSNSITVTLADRVSGEIFRKLVYDFSGELHGDARGHVGRMLDTDA